MNNWTVYELFRNLNDGKGWTEWELDYQVWPEKQGINLRPYVEEVFYIQFLQFIFYKQLDEITAYARKKGLRLMQDVPFYVNMNSMEVWSHKREFMVQPDGRPIQLAGCPPDHYHEHGQVWDKPMYNFDYIKEEQYVNFRNRFIWTARNFDAMRIVHFKGFDFIWKVPEDRNPEHGAWSAGPGRPLLEMIKNDLPNVLFTAEDQGLMRPTLKEMEKEFSIPVMDVLQYRMETKLLKRQRPRFPRSTPRFMTPRPLNRTTLPLPITARSPFAASLKSANTSTVRSTTSCATLRSTAKPFSFFLPCRIFSASRNRDALTIRKTKTCPTGRGS
ncbi:4-alpha-glucanotransferase [Allobaculum sp. Allo2]|nr:4-alpha-glucanotransferase [Allobaculum sp. Allo2]